jgi:hypothetical protein
MEILADGEERGRARARSTMAEVHRAMNMG